MSIETSVNRWFSTATFIGPGAMETVAPMIHGENINSLRWLASRLVDVFNLIKNFVKTTALFTEWIRCLILINLINFSLTNQITSSRLNTLFVRLTNAEDGDDDDDDIANGRIDLRFICFLLMLGRLWLVSFDVQSRFYVIVIAYFAVWFMAILASRACRHSSCHS